MECNETLVKQVGDDPTVDKTCGITIFSDIIIIIIIIVILNSRLLVIKWRSFGNSRSQQEIKAIYPLRVVCTGIIIIIIVIIIIIIIIIIISFMQGIYTHIPETNHVPREYSLSAILSLLFMCISLVPALALLYFYVRTFRSMCAVPNVTVFCISFTPWFPGMLLMYFLNDFEMVPVVPIITGIALVFTFHMRCISIVRSLYYYYYYYHHHHHHHHHHSRFLV